jgi:hypothetical protein
LRELGHELSRDLEERLHGRKLVQRFDNPIEIERDVLVDDDVPEAGQALQLTHQLRPESSVSPGTHAAEDGGIVAMTLAFRQDRPQSGRLLLSRSVIAVTTEAEEGRRWCRERGMWIYSECSK